MPIFSPDQIQKYAMEANQIPGLPSQQTVNTIDRPTLPKGLTGYKPDGSLPWGYRAGIVGANLFDAGTTRAALGNNKNAFESNPLMSPFAGNTPAFLAAKGGIGLVQAYGINNVAKKHPKLAKGLALASMAYPSIAGISNLRKMNQ